MNLLHSDVTLIPQQSGLDGIYKQIELIGRSCWMSQNSIKEDSAVPFVHNLKEAGHTAPFEHGTIYLTRILSSSEEQENYEDFKMRYLRNPYSAVTYKDTIGSDREECYITTNYRVIVENDWLDDLKYLTELNRKYHEPRLTFHFTCQRAISAEFNRHRHNSPMESSSRYCNFSGEKFGKEISLCVSDWLVKEAEEVVDKSYFKRPADIDAINSCNKGLTQYCYEVGNGYDTENMNVVDYWLFANLACEHSYMNMIRLGVKAEQAREILPLDLKTELYHTAFLQDWLHFCELRAWKSKGNSPHPEAMKLANGVFQTLKELGFVTDNFRKEREI